MLSVELLYLVNMMQVTRIITWEFIQNLPLVAGLILALQLWQQEQRLLALICILTGSVSGSLIIRFTEAKIVTKPREPLSVTFMNVIVMSLLMLVVIFYLAAQWSNWLTDLIVGGLMGVVLAVSQNLAAKKRIGIGHMMAFVIAFPLALISIRMLVNILPAIVAILLITFIITVVISFIDYGLLPSRK